MIRQVQAVAAAPVVAAEVPAAVEAAEAAPVVAAATPSKTKVLAYGIRF